MSDRIIKVTGKGLLKVKPDRISLILTECESAKDYQSAVNLSMVSKEKIVDCVKDLGFHSEDLKTVFFTVNEQNESYQDESGNFRTRLTGYEYTHEMKLEFPLDHELLSKILSNLSKGELNPRFMIQYTVSLENQEKYKELLLSHAWNDAKKKAEVLSKVANVKLKDVLEMNASSNEQSFSVHPYGEMRINQKFERGITMMDLTPEEISVSESVTVTFSMES